MVNHFRKNTKLPSQQILGVFRFGCSFFIFNYFFFSFLLSCLPSVLVVFLCVSVSVCVSFFFSFCHGNSGKFVDGWVDLISAATKRSPKD
uniref:Transmembrane protein n=1 Tax=Nelumbo nucifera TaxID=4432 RepID=A0A822ZZC6_NELNU|nr:TPA_asm: hypothetical protein HUJ06_018808 [Nelumbo nucifera]